jgi:tRNA threonylcarbamoyl adenosine modification protein YjeE
MNQTTNTQDTQPTTLRSHSVAETQRLGARLGALLEPGDVVLLHGDLGAGKTAFTQGIAAGMGVTTTVNSPTFTILKEYFGRLPLFHFDLYRIESPEEVQTLGFEDYFDSDGVSVIEWAERGEYPDSPDGAGADSAAADDANDDTAPADEASLWPANWLRITLTPVVGEREARELALLAQGLRGRALLAAFTQAAAGAQAGEQATGQTGSQATATGGADAAGD